MKKIIGGDIEAVMELGDGTQGVGESCRTSSGNPPNKTCKDGLKCVDNQNETGGTCRS